MIKNCTEKALWFVSLPKLCYIQYIKNGIFKKEIAKFTKFTLRMRRELTIPPSGQSQWRAPVSYWERDADCMPAVVSHWEKWKPRSSHVVDKNENSGKIFCHKNDFRAEFSKYFSNIREKRTGILFRLLQSLVYIIISTSHSIFWIVWKSICDPSISHFCQRQQVWIPEQKFAYHVTVPRYQHLAQWKNFRCQRANDDAESIFQAIQTAWIETVARGPRRMIKIVFVKVSRCEFKIQKISWILFERPCRLYEQTKICSRCQKWIKLTFSDIRFCFRVFQELQISSIYILKTHNLWNSCI